MVTINKIKEARRPHVRFISFSGKSVWGRGGSVPSILRKHAEYMNNEIELLQQ
jgi:hypothetical protein